MVSDSARVQNSAAFSVTLHGACLGLYVLLRLNQPQQSNVVLTQVEFLDLHPAPVSEAAAPPASRAPRGLRDFLKMALPSLKKPAEPQEGPQEMATPKDMQLPRLPDVQRLVDKNSPLSRGPSIQLKEDGLPRAAANRFADMTVPSAPRADDLAAVKEGPNISLEAVGRRAVRPGASPSIRIDPNASLSRSSRFAELPSGPPAGTAAPGPGMQSPAGISLGEGPALKRSGGGMPSSGLPLGYGGSSGGISLGERPVVRGRSALPAAAAAKPRPQESAPAEVAKSRKGMEITGPLAGRKILSAVMPAYPEWARSKGVEAEVFIRFFVSPDGSVLDRMILERTSGYKELDDLCMEALKKMAFVPLPKEAAQEDQWGIITFRFRLK